MIKNALVLCVILVVIFLVYLPSYLTMQSLHEKNRMYEKKISDLERDNVRLAEERRRLADDPSYFEKVAREKMGIIKDDEVIYKVIPHGQKKDAAALAESPGLIKRDDFTDMLIDPVGDVDVEADQKVTTVKKTAVKPSIKSKTKPVQQKSSKN